MGIFFVRRIIYLFLSVMLPFVFLSLISQVNVYADNLGVTITDDGGVGSLRQAVMTANQNPGPDTITFDLPPQSTIPLALDYHDYLTISDTLTIDGGTAVSLTIKGNVYGLFTIAPGTAVTITDLTLTRGLEAYLVPIHNVGGQVTVIRTSFIENGSVFNDGGVMFIEDSRFLDNEARYGVGILNDGELAVVNTLFRNNIAVSGGEGGAILNCGGASLTVTNSQFIDNYVEYTGGAIRNNKTDNPGDCGVKDSPGIVNISNSVFRGNYAAGGGALLNSGIMNIENSAIHDNEAGYEGGGILNDGILTIIASTITSNTANTRGGGGIVQSGIITISHSLIENNIAVMGGGGIGIVRGTTHIEDSAIVSNTAAYGGGVYAEVDAEYASYANMTIKNSTLSGNRAVGLNADGGGGAMKVVSPTNNITITQSTIANNAAPYQTGRDGIWQVDGTVLIQQSIVAGNGTENCTLDAGSWDGTAYNLASDASCAGFAEVDPLLTPLGDYGGNTLTHALLKGSLAVDAGD